MSVYQFFITYDGMPLELLEGVGNMNAYDWNVAFVEFMYKVIDADKLDEANLEEINPDHIQVYASMAFLQKILETYPVIVLDSAIESLVENSVPNLEDIKVPYPAFFVNKTFEIEDGYLMGMCVLDLRRFFHDYLISTGRTEEFIKEHMDKMLDEYGMAYKNSQMSFLFVFMGAENCYIAIIGTEELQTMCDSFKKQDIGRVVKKAMLYAANVSNLITTNVDLKNPLNPKRDIRIVPHYKNVDEDNLSKEKKEKRFGIIRAFGVYKQYAQDFEKEKRKYNISGSEPILVRGHFRNFKSLRYTHKRGQTIWILPFIKGMNKELHSRIMKLTE